MRKVSTREQEKLMGVLQRNEERLKSFAGVHHVDVGDRYIDGRPTEGLAVRVHVLEEKSESDLEPAEVLPKELDGVRIDVIESNPQPFQLPRTERLDVLIGGWAVAHPNPGAFGTLGMVVSDSQTGAPMGLTNRHVFSGNVGDNVAQPATTNANDVMRHARAFRCSDLALHLLERLRRPRGPRGRRAPARASPG